MKHTQVYIYKHKSMMYDDKGKNYRKGYTYYLHDPENDYMLCCGNDLDKFSKDVASFTKKDGYVHLAISFQKQFDFLYSTADARKIENLNYFEKRSLEKKLEELNHPKIKGWELVEWNV